MTGRRSGKSNACTVMDISQLSKRFFEELDRRIGPFDRPIRFRVYPFESGGALNFLTIGAGREEFVTYVSWDLLGCQGQRRGNFGRYEIMAVCDSEDWCLDVLTNIGRQSMQTVFEPGDTLDIVSWVGPDSSIQGVLFEEALRLPVKVEGEVEVCGLLRCIGVGRSELERARREGVAVVIDHLRQSGIYPRTITRGRAT